MAHVAGAKRKASRFEIDSETGEWEKPGPSMDPEAAAIASAISKIKKREKAAPVILKWNPRWLKKEQLTPFSFYFFEDALIVDLFNRDKVEMDALEDDLTQRQREEIAAKSVLCSANKIQYLFLGPDDDLDMVQLAAKLGTTTRKKGEGPQRKSRRVMPDEIQEEENDF